jgi:6-phosphogluconolactonase
MNGEVPALNQDAPGLYGEVIVVDDVPGEFSERVVEAFLNRPGDSFSLVLSGGGTARRCYERLAADGSDQLDWWQVDVYWGDERCVPPEDPDSNERLGREALLERVGAANAVYPMRCDEGPDPYQQRVAQAGRLDVVHLGLGPDGHTASLFPGSPALDADPGRLVVMNTDPKGNNVHRRMTLTFSGIARARLAVVTVEGAEKREAFAAVRRGDPDKPATRIRADRVVWLVDPAAAGD